MAYEEIRHPRCEQTHLHHQRLDAIMKYPVGPQQYSRDAILRRTLAYTDFDHMDPEAFQSMFGDHLISFAYDACEAVDDWWTKWGSFLARDDDKQQLSSKPALQVWISREQT
jgi:salicylate hydroxylase